MQYKELINQMHSMSLGTNQLGADRVENLKNVGRWTKALLALVFSFWQ